MHNPDGKRGAAGGAVNIPEIQQETNGELQGVTQNLQLHSHCSPSSQTGFTDSLPLMGRVLRKSRDAKHSYSSDLQII